MSQVQAQSGALPFSTAIQLFTSCELQDLFELSAAQGGMLTAKQAEKLMQDKSISFKNLQDALLPVCDFYAIAPISNFLAGAIVQGEQQENGLGNLYFGANLEFENQALSLVVHAEQAAIHNAWHHGETKISGMTINAAPCGYCRQFINEIRNARSIPLNIAGQNCGLDDLLPNPFSPETLGNDVMLFDETRQTVEFSEHNQQQISDALQNAIETSYAPYSKNLSACEIALENGQKFIGRYAENCAYSPSLSPVQAALSQMVMHGLNPTKQSITKVTLIELEGAANQIGVAKAVISSLPYEVNFVHVEGKLN